MATRYRLFITGYLVACVAAVTGCSSSQPDLGYTRLGWGEGASTKDFEEVVLGAYLSPESSQGDGDGLMALAYKDGHVALLKTESLENGAVAADARGNLSVATTSKVYLVDRNSNRIAPLRKQVGPGHWAGLRSDGSFVSVFNSGAGDRGYEADVVWEYGKQVLQTVVPDVPGAVGTDADVLYVANRVPLRRNQTNSLYAVSLQSGERPEKVLEWKLPNVKGGWASAGTSDLFAYKGALWFFDDTCLLNSTDDQIAESDGSRSTLMLGRIDLKSKDVSSSVLKKFDTDSIIDTGNGWSPVAQAAIGSHLYDGRLYTIDHDGNILAADLATRRLGTVGRVSAKARGAFNIRVSWSGGIMTTLSVSAESALIENYDLGSGRLLASTEAPGLARVMAEDPSLVLWSQAAGPASLR